MVGPGDWPAKRERRPLLELARKKKRTIILVLTAAAFMAIVALLAFSWTKATALPGFTEPPVPDGMPIMSENNSEYLSNREIEEIIIRHLAVNAWGEAMERTAKNNTSSFAARMMSEPSVKCSTEYRANRLASSESAGAAELDKLMRCAEAEAELSSRLRPGWEEMSDDFPGGGGQG